MSSASSSLPESLRAALLEPADALGRKVHGRTKAGVLVALYLGPRGDRDLHAVFTRRRHDLRSHAGEISFPGGRHDDDDADLRATALREAEEEIGLPRDAVELLGALTPTPTVATNFGVYPFVGLIAGTVRWTPSPREVEEVLELPLANLRAARAPRRLLHRGIPFRSVVFDVAPDTVIWGATARIVDELLTRLAPLLDDAAGA